jgi:hypothetical protein
MQPHHADQVLVIATDSHIRPEFLVDAIRREVLSRPLEISYIELVLPAVLPPTLPICAVPPRVAGRLGRLRAAAWELLECSPVPGAAAVVPCRSVVALLDAVDRVDRLVLVGSARWSVRRAARRVADDVVVVSTRASHRVQRPVPTQRVPQPRSG